MRKRGILTGLLILCMLLPARATRRIPTRTALQPMCDSLSSLLLERTTVRSTLKIRNVSARGKDLVLDFSNTLSDYPWHKEDQEWFRNRLSEALDTTVPGFRTGNILCNGIPFQELSTPYLTYDGQATEYRYECRNPEIPAFIRKEGGKNYTKGLSNRYIALWQSHGRYYDVKDSTWRWQRAAVHRTVEDLFTQSYVLPFLIPMLENAGAYIVTPRERDTQWREIIMDNDPSFEWRGDNTVRRKGGYEEYGKWEYSGEGFADLKAVYTFSDNPFKSGTARMASCSGEKADSYVRWIPEIEERGAYAVYISYRTTPESTEEAHYTVHHLGGNTEFTVNQKMGGETWIYLGTFEFGKGKEGYIKLDNRGPEGCTVSADAVRIGGGMGKLARGGSTSGMPSYVEGAHYCMQWAGVDSSITRAWPDDYTNDFASKGAWTVMMKEEKHIPFDLSLAFHSDAGMTPNDSTIGTLSIYTLKCENSRKFKDGRDRMMSRLLADYVQTQVISDIRADFEPEWARRELWDRSYSESRTTDVPGIILETMSHQNFADMKYGHDPSFKFALCRAVYKGILKTLSEYYGCQYAVQPLPVNSFAAELISRDKVRLIWQPTKDPKEPTAGTDGYILYTRIDDGVFDNGREISGNSAELSLKPGHIYSFKVTAFNEGGQSFPSEILSAGIPDNPESTVLIVNNFYRVSAPDFIEGPEYAGFNAKMDSGVPYVSDISFSGENYEFNRKAEFVDNDYPGFGASYVNNAPCIIAGNTFDYPYIHGKALMELGYAFCSSSAKAFENFPCAFRTVDLICGKQKTTTVGRGAVEDRYSVFPQTLKDAIREFASNGGSMIISGANIASDDAADFFTMNTLGYKYATYSATNTGMVGKYPFHNKLNRYVYCVECPDGLAPAGRNDRVILRYPDSHIPAAILHKGKGYSIISMGVPIETLKSEADRKDILKKFLQELQAN